MEEKILTYSTEFYRAKEVGLRQCLISFWKNYFLMKLNKGDLDEMILGLETIRNEINTNEDLKKTDWTLITINPYLHTKMSELKAVVEKIVSKKWITTYAYTYEQRSESNDEYKGFHCHLLLYRQEKSNSHLIREIRNTCKNICDISNTHILNFRNLKGEDDVKKAYNYITGIKADENKHIKQMIDKEFRNYYYLRAYYEKDPKNILSNLLNKTECPTKEEDT